MAKRKIPTIFFAVAGVLIIVAGLMVASTLSCGESQFGHGPPIYTCPDGIYSGPANPHPFFDTLMPWLLGGALLLLTAAYRYEKSRAPKT